MDIKLNWGKPLPLRNGSADNLIYTVDFGAISTNPGLYIFFRTHGEFTEVFYIGQAVNLQRRLIQQFNNTRLMKSIENRSSGTRYVVPGEIINGRGQKIKRALDIAEGAFIRYYLANKHELINIRGTVIERHTIESERNTLKDVIPIRIFSEKK